ncbi:hypothetical protein IFM89_030594 [Coptis chinensis]|uniref:Uncharacterized protein n=1 Tax=Coptis chinensis TaxID=261450 RepID=A0A835HPQ9_9MAGN|nr:hypothetical protein IFM89_030594 [Coptis chinensis]
MLLICGTPLGVTIDDILRANPNLSESELERKTLLEVEILMNENGWSLKDYKFDIPEADEAENRMIQEELNYNCNLLSSQYLQLHGGLNVEQKTVFDAVISAVEKALMDYSRSVEMNSENSAIVDDALTVFKENFTALSSSQDTLQETEGATSDKNRDDPQPNTEKQNSFGRDFVAQKHSLSNPPGHRPRPTHNSSYNSGYHQKQRCSNKGHQQRIYNDRNFNRGHNNAPPAPVNWQSRMPGYVYDHFGFHGLLPLPPHSPYLHPHFAFMMNNHPLDANVPFPPIPFSALHWIYYPGYGMLVGYNGNPYFQGGVAFGPQTPHPTNLQDLEYKLYDAIKDQIEFYFSFDTLFIKKGIRARNGLKDRKLFINHSIGSAKVNESFGYGRKERLSKFWSAWICVVMRRIKKVINYEASSLSAKEIVGPVFSTLAFYMRILTTNCKGQLWLLCASNINTEKLARVAVRHGLFHFVRHNPPSLDAKVNEFSLAIKKEEQACEISAYGGKVKAPKVLADIVEPVAAAVHVNAKFDLKFMWEVFSPLLEPIIVLENLQQQPLTMLYELCQK